MEGMGFRSQRILEQK